MRSVKVLVRIVFVFFIASGINYFGVDEDNHYDKCCNLNGAQGEILYENNEINLEKDKMENLGENNGAFVAKEAENFVNAAWLNDKSNDFSLILFKKKEDNILEFKDKNINIKIELEKYEGKTTIKNLSELKDKLNTDKKKWVLFEIKYKKDEKGNGKEEIVYLYCSDIESVNEKGIFEDMVNFLSVSVIVCNTENVTDMQEMFSYCKELQQLDLKNFNTQNVVNMNSMFCGCKKLEKLNLSNFNTKNVISMNKMFSYCEKLQQLDLKKFCTEKVTDMNGMFCCCRNMNQLYIDNFNTGKVTNMENMFGFCEKLQQLDLKNFCTENVAKMNSMFFCCENLENLNLSNFNTGKVTNMENMFGFCEKLQQLDLANFNTENVTNMCSMFSHCKNLQILNIKNFNTKKVKDMRFMFSFCQKLQQLDICSFNFGKVEVMNHMFYGCSALNSLLWGKDANIGEGTKIDYMFSYCEAIQKRMPNLNLNDSIAIIEYFKKIPPIDNKIFK